MRKGLLAKVGAVHRTIDGAGTPGTAKARRKFKHAGRQLQLFINAVTHARGKISAGIGDKLLGTANLAKSKLLPFQK
jgi:hypothetical protein